MPQKVCQNCAKCIELGAVTLAKKSANAALIVSTMGMSALASGMVGAFRKKCPDCGHLMSDHNMVQKVEAQNYAPPTQVIYVQAPPVPPTQNASTPAPTAMPTVNPNKPIVCLYCRRPNAPTSYSCAGCSAPLPVADDQDVDTDAKAQHVLFSHERPGFKFTVFGDRIEIAGGIAGGGLEGLGNKIEGLGGVASNLRKQRTIYIRDVRETSIAPIGAKLQLRLSDGSNQEYLLGFRTKEARDAIIEAKAKR